MKGIVRLNLVDGMMAKRLHAIIKTSGQAVAENLI
jgi:hypothetical protein